MPRYYDDDDYDRYDDSDEEVETEGSGGHRTDYRVARKARTIGYNFGRQVVVNVGDLVKVVSYFTYNTSDHPDEPNIRTGYSKFETKVAFGPNGPAGAAGKGNWCRSKKGSYEAYHGPMPQAALERIRLLAEVGTVSEAAYSPRHPAVGVTPQVVREAVSSLVADVNAWEASWDSTFVWPSCSTPDEMLSRLLHREKREAAVAEHHVACRAAKGATVTYDGRTYIKGGRFTKLIMHSNLEYAGGAGDCTAEGRFHLLAPEGADYAGLQPAFSRFAPRN
jgi:hypothetical protein